jgi:acetyl esterase/lipase
MTEETPLHKKAVVFTIPSMDDVVAERDIAYASVDNHDLLLDVYRPSSVAAGQRLPGVIFIHGGPVPPDFPRKDSGQYQSWGKLAAASELVGITFNHDYHAPEQLPQSAANVLAAIAFVRENAARFHLDPNRICLWTCSGGGPHICFALRDQPAYVRCLVVYYAIMDVQPVSFLVDALSEEEVRRYSAVSHIQDKPLLFPTLLVRTGLDNEGLNETITRFAAQDRAMNSPIEVINHPQGQHGFDILDDNLRSQQIIERTLAFIQENI